MRRFLAPTTTMALLALAIASPSASALAPTIIKTTVSEVTSGSVTLEAEINPQGKAGFYSFEYGPGDCSANACTIVPGGELNPVGVPERVKAPLAGLAAGTTYHLRVVAVNSLKETALGPDRTFMTYLPPQDFAACPNERFRGENPAGARIERSSAGLPDCRAYERATPLDKDGGDASGTVPFARAALAGGIGFLSSSGLPGGKGSQELPAYFASRNSAAWSTEGLLPPGDSGQNAAVLGWTPDFSAVFTRATRLGEPAETELLMTPAGGTPVKIVDYVPGLEPRFAGASEGAGRVLFESKVALAGVAGAIAGKSNVYLWDKARAELSLAGVLNDGKAPSAGAFAGSYDWVKGTGPATLAAGGADRDYYTQEQHAISTGGSAVYFTAAGTGRLYVRRNPAAEQSALGGGGECTEAALACTIEVSASHKSNGAGPGGTDSGGPRPAAFMGAGADGSVSLFTSSEMLTDDANTGPEQEPAAIERADIGGTLASGCVPTHALGIALDAAHIYWADPTSSTIGRANLDCTATEGAFIATGPGTPQYVAVANGHIFWTNMAAGEKINQFPPTEEGTIGEAKLNGDGAASEVKPSFVVADAKTGEGLSSPQGIAVDATHIYWANPQDGDKSIGRADIDGGNADLHFIKIEINRTPQGGVAVDAGHLYWTTHFNGGVDGVVRCDLDGNTSSELFLSSDDGSDPRGITVDGGHVYWARRGGSTIARANLDLGEPQLEWIKDADNPFGVVVNSSDVYWSSNGEAPSNPGSDLYLYDVIAGELSDLAPDSLDENGVEARGVLGASEDNAYVYFVANGIPDGTSGSPNARGEEAKAGTCPDVIGDSASGSCNLYLWRAETGASSFIARLQVGGGESQTDATNWAATTSSDLFPTTNFEKTARVSPDGRTLLFRSQRQLTGYDNEGTAQLYRYRAGEAGPSCVSCNPTGAAPGGGVGFGDVFPSVVVPANPASALGHNLSADGNRVFFETTDPLVGADTNGALKCAFSGSALQSYPSCLDVYEWEAQGTGSCDGAHAVAQGGCLYLLSTGKGSEPALIADASTDGTDAFFFTRSRLVGQDEDQLIDVYDAREGGGLAEQNQPPPNPCQNEACKPAPSASGGIQSPPKFSGPGNPKAKSPPCKKPKRRIEGRCVAKHPKGKKGGKGAKSKSGAKRGARR